MSQLPPIGDNYLCQIWKRGSLSRSDLRCEKQILDALSVRWEELKCIRPAYTNQTDALATLIIKLEETKAKESEVPQSRSIQRYFSLFDRLFEKIRFHFAQVNHRCPIKNPFQISAYKDLDLQLRTAREEDALRKIWNEVFPLLKYPDIPSLQEPSDLAFKVRKWLLDPAHASKLAAFSTLHLSKLKIYLLPKAIFSFSSLIALNLSHNCLSTFAVSTVYLRFLEELDLSHNQLQEFSATSSNFSKLQRLNLSHNQISQFRTPTLRFGNLRQLDLSFNRLTSFQAASAQFPCIEKLNLSFNELSRFIAIQVEWPDLQSIDLSYNRITEFIFMPLSAISLHTLDLSNNRLKTLSVHKDSLPRLQQLIVNANPLPASYFGLHPLNAPDGSLPQ
jgi:Leucine-rich repeat (LRR) protein